MFKFMTLVLGLLALVSELSAAQTIRVMPFGASIVSVRSPFFSFH
jgi:hypothetical protein